MAGKKGRSGRVSGELQTWCATVSREVALPKMWTVLNTQSPKSVAWRWCFEQLAKLGNLYAPLQHEHSGRIELQEAARTFQSRNDRLLARLGAAAIPEFPE